MQPACPTRFAWGVGHATPCSRWLWGSTETDIHCDREVGVWCHVEGSRVVETHAVRHSSLTTHLSGENGWWFSIRGPKPCGGFGDQCRPRTVHRPCGAAPVSANPGPWPMKTTVEASLGGLVPIVLAGAVTTVCCDNRCTLREGRNGGRFGHKSGGQV